jgi:hypothetical protein
VLPGFVAHDALPGAPSEWSTPSEEAKGEFNAKSLMRPADLARRILPAELFKSLQKHATSGVPTDCGPAWPREVIDQAMKTGPHTSALSEENVKLIWEDVQYQERLGFVRILTEKELRHELPLNLKVSRVAIVPQVNRRGRIILNLSAEVEMPTYRPKGKRRKFHHDTRLSTTRQSRQQTKAVQKHSGPLALPSLDLCSTPIVTT